MGNCCSGQNDNKNLLRLIKKKKEALVNEQKKAFEEIISLEAKESSLLLSFYNTIKIKELNHKVNVQNEQIVFLASQLDLLTENIMSIANKDPSRNKNISLRTENLMAFSTSCLPHQSNNHENNANNGVLSSQSTSNYTSEFRINNWSNPNS